MCQKSASENTQVVFCTQTASKRIKNARERKSRLQTSKILYLAETGLYLQNQGGNRDRDKLPHMGDRHN